MLKFISVLLLLNAVSGFSGIFGANHNPADIFSSVAVALVSLLAGICGLMLKKRPELKNTCVVLGFVIIACTVVEILAGIIITHDLAVDSSLAKGVVVFAYAITILIPLIYILTAVAKPGEKSKEKK